jgi:hypothetical protein
MSLDPFRRVDRKTLDDLIERLDEECELIGFCPYCGVREFACHRLDSHPEMWIGGPNAYGTAFHGWADH